MAHSSLNDRGAPAPGVAESAPATGTVASATNASGVCNQASRAPRGIRNNNPGNLRRGEPWQGLAPEQTDPAFCVFSDPVWGIRALARTLLTYESRHGLATVAGLIGRFAPPCENDTAAYVAAVSRVCGVAPHAPIRVAEQLPALIPAIIRHENGCQPYPADLIARAIDLAKGGR